MRVLIVLLCLDFWTGPERSGSRFWSEVSSNFPCVPLDSSHIAPEYYRVSIITRPLVYTFVSDWMLILFTLSTPER